MGMNALTQTFLDLVSIDTSSIVGQKRQKPSYGQISVLNIIAQELRTFVPEKNIKIFYE